MIQILAPLYLIKAKQSLKIEASKSIWHFHKTVMCTLVLLTTYFDKNFPKIYLAEQLDRFSFQSHRSL